MRRSSIRPLLAVVVAVSLASASGCSSATVKGTAAGIVTEPADATVKVGSPASFTVQATGDAPLAYQWRRNGTAIEGAGGKSYTILAAALTDSGATFSVVVKNAAGSAQSREALLTVTSDGNQTPTLTVDTIDRAGLAADHFFAWQDGDGPWQAHTGQSPGHHELPITSSGGRYSVAYADADSAPRNLSLDPAGTPAAFTGVILHATLAEAKKLTLPLGPPPYQPARYAEQVRVSTGADAVTVSLPGTSMDFAASNGGVAFSTPTMAFVPSATYSAVARTAIPTAGSVLVIDTVSAIGAGQSLDFGSFQFASPVIAEVFPNDPAGKHLSIAGATAGAAVAIDYGVTVPQGLGVSYVLNPALHSVTVADGTGAATVVMKSPRIKSATWSGSYFVSAYATDAQGSFLGVTAFPQTGADLHFTLPPPFAYSPASVKASTPYPRIEQAFTTSTDGTVHTISYGLPDRGWTAFATTAWFGAAGKPVTWEFPDLTAVAGWGGALWADWAMGDFTVALTTSSCATLQRTVLESLLPPTPQPGDSCSTIQTNGSDVTLP